VPSGHLGQTDFPAGQADFHSRLPIGEGPEIVINQLNKRVNLKTCPVQAKLTLRARPRALTRTSSEDLSTMLQI